MEETTKGGNLVGNFQLEPVMPQETHVGYVEGYLDVLEKVENTSFKQFFNAPQFILGYLCYKLAEL